MGTLRPSIGRHNAQFYEDDSFLRDVVSRFIAVGLIAGERSMVVVTPEHWAQISIALEARSIDVRGARDVGRLIVADARETAETYTRNGMPDAAELRAGLERALGPERTPFRVFGEWIDLIWLDGKAEAAIRAEEIARDFLRDAPVTALCGYRMSNFHKESDGEAFRTLCDLHQHVDVAEGVGGDLTEQRRAIAYLQQRARALETELVRRRDLEAALRSARKAAEMAGATLGEIRAELDSILLAARNLRRTDAGASASALDAIDRHSHRLIRMLDGERTGA
jgi:hypothetical protein